MNKEEIINNSVKHCCICDNKKYGEFISINDEKYHLCCIEQLQQENKQLQQELDKKNKIIEEIKEYVNFLVIFNQNINGKFSETQWGEDILGIIEELEKGE